VVGDDIQFIASGPTSPDSTTFANALSVCEAYGLKEKLSQRVLNHLESGVRGDIPENPKSTDIIFQERVRNLLIGSAKTSAQAVSQYLVDYYKIDHVHIFSNSLSGEASQFGKNLPSLILSMISCAPKEAKTLTFIATGEFTVTIRGKGIGGRNQEMLLGFLLELKNQQSQHKYPLSNFNFVISAAAFDCIEGNSPAMGAIVDNTSLERAEQEGFDLEEILLNNNSFALFQKLGDAIITGQTGTNVNDMLLIILERAQK